MGKGKNINGKVEKHKDSKYVYELIKDCPYKLGLKTKKEAIESFWKYWRHKLIHLVAPNSFNSILSFTPDKNIVYEEIQDNVKEEVFYKKDNNYVCFIDLFPFELDNISDWIIEKVEKQDDIKIKIYLFG